MCNLSGYVEEKGIKKGIEQGINRVIQSALKNGKTPEQVASFLGLPLDEVKKVNEEMLQKA